MWELSVVDVIVDRKIIQTSERDAGVFYAPVPDPLCWDIIFVSLSIPIRRESGRKLTLALALPLPLQLQRKRCGVGAFVLDGNTDAVAGRDEHQSVRDSAPCIHPGKTTK